MPLKFEIFEWEVVKSLDYKMIFSETPIYLKILHFLNTQYNICQK